MWGELAFQTYLYIVNTIIMKTERKNELVMRLLHETISEDEEQELLKSSFLEKHMLGQWSDCRLSVSTDATRQKRIWEKINDRIWNTKTRKKLHFYRIYSAAASVLLLFFAGLSLFFSSQSDNYISTYVVNSGIQSIESITLPDGSKVQLGANSTLEYPAGFTGKSRRIKLDGQAFFDVAQNRNKPFIVETPAMDVEALGTAFELFCHRFENKSEAILLKGKIRIDIKDPETKMKTEHILSPNEKLTYSYPDRKISKKTVDADKYSSWRKQKILTFENEALNMIIPRLEQWYGRKIICQKDLAGQYRFSFKIRDESLERILFMLGESSPIQYEKTGNGDYILSLDPKYKQP